MIVQTEPTKLFTSSFSFSQVRSAGSGTETQLRISWDSVLNAQQTGRWWIVGSAWSGAPMIDNSQQKTLEKHPSGTVQKPCSPTRSMSISPTVSWAFPGVATLFIGWLSRRVDVGLFKDRRAVVTVL